MDQIFDRLGRLLRSLGAEAPRERGRPGDPDLRDAEDELEAFLRGGQEPQRSSGSGPSASQQSRREAPRPSSPGLSEDLLKAYEFLGLSPTASWEDIVATHRSLLKKHHPDRHAGHEANMRKATAMSQKIGEAFQKIKKHLGR